MRLSSQEIRRLTDLWKQNAISPQGVIQLGAKTECYRLHANQIGFHELDYDELCTACVELTKQLLLPGHNTVIDLDHYLLWSWCAELLLGRGGPLSTSIDREISQLAQTTTRAALTGATLPTREAFERANQARSSLNHNARYLIDSSHVVLSYICFPLLEAVGRRACPAYVNLNGVVQQPFARANGNLYQIGSRCSNVSDILRLLRDNVAGSALRNNLIEILTHVGNIASASDGCSAIFDWRNSSLHGETTFQTIGGTVYTLSLMISLDSIESHYIQLRDAATSRIQQEQQIAQMGGPIARSPWSYYPPV